MSVLSQLASSFNRRDQVPNQELASRIAEQSDDNSVAELIGLLDHKDKSVRHDAIKVLYEIGALKPALIAGFLGKFKELLQAKDNRMQWGSMTALHTIASECTDDMRELLPALAQIAEKGSVITRDQFVSILVKLIQADSGNEDLFALVMEQLSACPENQLPMYAEQAMTVVPEIEKASLRAVLNDRIDDIEKASKRQRIEKVMKKLGK